MAFLVIPLENAPELGNLNFTTSMDGVSYKIYLKYNGREDFWYADLEDIEENIIRQGIKVVSNWALLRLIQTTPRPPGELMAIDTRFSPIDPSLAEFGNEIELLYVEEGSLPS
jgi:hypothetical protein